MALATASFPPNGLGDLAALAGVVNADQEVQRRDDQEVQRSVLG
jgi:hypothetical protein